MGHPTNESPLPLKQACLRAARGFIAEHGVEALSLREVARRLGVSHQAPYRHYPTRDHLLVEVIRECFRDFAAFLDDRPSQHSPRADLGALGQRYLMFAQTHPVEYRLMFGTPWPAVGETLGLAEDATHAFDILRGVLRRVHEAQPSPEGRVDLDAMFIWSALHGMSAITQADVMHHLRLSPGAEDGLTRHLFAMMGAALDATAGRDA